MRFIATSALNGRRRDICISAIFQSRHSAKDVQLFTNILFFSILSALNTMAAIKSLMTRDSVAHLAKRQNWAAREPGVIVVFCIVGVGMSTPAFSFCDDLC